METEQKLIIFKIMALSVPILILFGICEASLRLWGPKYHQFNNSSAEYYSNPREYFVPLRSEGTSVIYGLNYVHTSEGYRASSVIDVMQKKNNVLGLGDSFTFGRGVRYEDIYLTKLEKLFNDDGVALGIKNCGMIGLDIEDIYKTYRFETAKKKYPLVIYGFVLNDFGLIQRGRIVGSDFIDINNGGNRYAPLRKLSAVYNYAAFVLEQHRLHTVTVQAYRDAFTGKNADEKFKVLLSLHEQVDKDGGKLLIALFPLLYDLKHYPFSEVHATMSQFCKEHNIAFVDLLPAFSAYTAEDLWAHPTDHHPNEVAHGIAADTLFRYMSENPVFARIIRKQGNI